MISDEFKLSLPMSGHLVVNCQSCYRTHFSVSSRREGDYEEGELEDLLDAEKEDSNSYISTNDDFVESARLDGKTYVLGCECGFLEKMERFLWDNREFIIDYLKRRTKKNAERAEREKKVIDDL